MDSFLQRLAPAWIPHPGQREFLLASAPVRVLACGRRWGKTDACAAATLGALSRRGPPTRHFLVAPTLDQARILFDRVVELFHLAAERCSGLFDLSQLRLKASPHPKLRYGHHRLDARSGHLPRALRGYEATHLVVDEASYVPDALIEETLWPMLATTDGTLTLLGTPHGRNAFYRFFKMGEAGDPTVWSRRSPSRENPRVSERFLAVQRALLSERSFAVEYEAAFLESSAAVFRMDAVLGCVDSGLKVQPRGTTWIGVDFGRRQDYTALAALSGDRNRCTLVGLERFQGGGWSEHLDRILEFCRRYPEPQLVCDSTGVGDVLLGYLRERLAGLAPVNGLHFSSSSKASLIGRLEALFERDALRMAPDPVLLSELERFEASPTPTGRLQFEAGHGHDDLVVALALAAWSLPTHHGPLLLPGRDRIV